MLPKTIAHVVDRAVILDVRVCRHPVDGDVVAKIYLKVRQEATRLSDD